MTPEVWVRSQHSAACDDPGAATRAAGTLDDGELRRWRQLADPGARRDYLAAHLLRRGMLAARTAIDAAAFHFRSCAGGQERVVEPRSASGFRASLVHRDGIALCAVAYGLPVGTSLRSRHGLSGGLLAISALVESPRALRALDAQPAPEREERMMRLWTVREAIGRARGARLGEPATEAPPDSAWQYVCWWLTSEHLAAVAVRRPGPREGVAIRVEGDVLSLVACA